MGTINKPNTFSAAAVIVAAEHNSNFDTIYSEFNGSISNANIDASAAIADTKLAQITTASKVNLTALVATSQAQGDVIYATSGSAFARLAKGTANQALVMNSGATAPEWSDTMEGVGAPGSFYVSATGDDTTTSTSYEILDSMTITFTPSHASNPILILFSSSGEHSSNSATPSHCIINDSVGGDIAATEREISAAASSSGAPISIGINIMHYTTLSAAEHIISVHFKTHASTFTVHERSLAVIEFKQN